MRKSAFLSLLMAASLGVAYSLDWNPAPQFIDSAPSFSQPLAETKALLEKQAPDLRSQVVNTVLLSLECAKENANEHNSILAVIDYSLPSSEKRLWIFDLAKQKLLFHTYVSHGFNSGTASPTFFSNTVNGKTSSVGVFNTQQTYKGRYGESLKLCGVDENFNDNAFKRFIVVHGTWYVSEDFIKKYGRAGRSWGCPTVSLDLVNQITEVLKDNAFMVVYYPDKKWLAESKFLNCAAAKNSNISKPDPAENTISADKPRDAIMFVDLNKSTKLDENETILVVKADDYKQMFNINPPLEQMLRRQINGAEYIALSDKDIQKMMQDKLQAMIYFVVPRVEKVNGYYATEMKIIDAEKISNIELNSGDYIIYFDKKPSVILKATQQFIRWLGL